MASASKSPFFCLFLFSAFCHHSLPLPTAPLAYKCSSPQQPNVTNKTTHFLLAALMATAATTGFARASVVVGEYNLTGLVQCWPDLRPTACAACLRSATESVFNVCRNSSSVSVLFDGCNVHYYYCHCHSSCATTELSQQARPLQTRLSTSGTSLAQYYEDSGSTARPSVYSLAVVGCWIVGVACLVGVAFGAWLLRRKVISVKVASFPLEEANTGGVR